MSEQTKRPEPETYPTFTSRKKATTICLQKPRYGVDEFKIRRLVDDKVTITIQAGVEFDAYRECLGDHESQDKGFKGNPYFLKLVKDGYMKDGKNVKLHPDILQKFLTAQAGEEAGTNAVILWKNRKRSEKEKELESIIDGHKTVTKRQAADLARMRELLKKNNIPFEPKA